MEQCIKLAVSVGVEGAFVLGAREGRILVQSVQDPLEQFAILWVGKELLRPLEALGRFALGNFFEDRPELLQAQRGAAARIPRDE